MIASCSRRRVATLDDDLVEDAKAVLRELKGEEARLTAQLAEERRRAPIAPANPEKEIRGALQLLDQLVATV